MNRMTETELAEKLREECGANRHNGWNHAARKIAEATGYELAPEKPEPGTWWIVADGPNVGKVARANGYAGLSLYGEEGQVWSYTDCDSWPDLTPARVVTEAEYQRLVSIRAYEAMNPADAQYAPAEPPVLSEDEVGAYFDEVETVGVRFREMAGHFTHDVTATVNAALAQQARTVPEYVELTSEEVVSRIDHYYPKANYRAAHRAGWDAAVAAIGGAK